MHEEPRAAFLPLPLIIHDDYYTVLFFFILKSMLSVSDAEVLYVHII